MDPDVELSAASPAPCLLAPCQAPHLGNNGLNFWHCKQTTIKCWVATVIVSLHSTECYNSGLLILPYSATWTVKVVVFWSNVITGKGENSSLTLYCHGYLGRTPVLARDLILLHIRLTFLFHVSMWACVCVHAHGIRFNLFNIVLLCMCPCCCTDEIISSWC